jgi:AAA domain-containing protein/LAGLIDADG DNA endonuclease family protein
MAPWPTEAPGVATPGEDRGGMPSPAARNGARADHGGVGVSQDATGAQRPPSEPSVAPDEVARRRAEHERAERERLRRRHFDNEQIRRDVKRELDLRELVDPPDAETRRVRLTKASDFKIKAVRWVWSGRMPMGEITLIPGREGVGKALALDTPILTDRGWLTMDEVKAGDQVCHPSGGWTSVLAVTEPMTDRQCFEVVFSDGARIVADADHLWRTETLNARERRKGEAPTVRTTRDVAETLWARGGHCLNHAIPMTAPLAGVAISLPIDPYVLGAWLGDGHSAGARLTCADPEIVNRIRDHEPCRHMGGLLYSLSDGRYLGRHADTGRTLPVRLRNLGVLDNKHIPEMYLRASYAQRIALLQGLMDTDGTIGANGRCEFSVCNQALAEDVRELLTTLGIKVTLGSGPAKLKGRTVGTRWRLSFRTGLPVFHLPRKAARLKPITIRRHDLRYVTAVNPVPSVPVRCIQVAAEDGMYLAGRGLVPTHNSTFLAWLAAKLTKGELPGVWDGTKRAVLYAATEDSWEHTIAPRMLAAGADMDLVYRVDVQVVEGKYGKLLLPTDVMELTTAALDVEAAALMCDPVISVLADRINTFKAQELRSALEPLRMAAEHAGMAVAGLVHFNKGKDTDVLTSVSGSRAWTEVARAVVAIAKDPDADEYTCVVSQVKNNLGRSDLPHLAYTIGSATVETHDGGETEVGRLRWTSDGYARGVEDILNPPKEKKRSELHQKVIDFVIETEEETGRAVSTGEVIRRFGGATSEGNLKQILSRFARDGVLRRTDRGLYGAPGDGDEAVRRCPGPCDGTKLGQDENFCANCRKRLDQDSAAESSQDTLY